MVDRDRLLVGNYYDCGGMEFGFIILYGCSF